MSEYEVLQSIRVMQRILVSLSAEKLGLVATELVLLGRAYAPCPSTAAVAMTLCTDRCIVASR